MGLVINSATGVINVSASTPGTYTVTYTISGVGSVSKNITIHSTPTATITGATSYCQGTGGTTLIASGDQQGDTIEWYKNGVATGQSSATITGQLAGTYFVKITRPSGGSFDCADESSNHVITEISSQNSNFNYQNSSYAQDGTDPTPSITTPGGSFSAPSGLSINSSTGQIDLSASSVGSYLIQYSLPAPCPSTTNRTIGITAAGYQSVYSIGLDGTDDYLQENYHSVLSGQNYFTISMWVYITGSISFQPFINAWTNPYLYIVRYNNGVLQFYQRKSNNTNALTQSTVSLEKNRWYNIIAVKDFTTNRLYLDGVLKATATNTSSMKSANVGSRIGNYGNARGEFLIDEVTQYTTAFTQANVTSQYNNGIPTTPVGSPVNWWKMGEDSAGNASTIANDGTGNNFLTRLNGASYFVEPAGIFNQRSIDFDGTDDMINMTDAEDWSFIGGDCEDAPLSIVAWIKPDTITQTGILGKYKTGGYEWMLYLISGQIRFIVRENTEGIPYKLLHTPNNTVSANQWVHIAVTYDGVHAGTNYGMKIYRNGTNLTNVTRGSSGTYCQMANTSTPMGIGAFSGAGGGEFNGKIDEVALFDYEITANAVSEIYNSGSPQIDLNNLSNATTDPIMWARCGDRDSYSTLTNRGSVNINGTYTNMTESDINFDVKT